jgi:hypothetical protein
MSLQNEEELMGRKIRDILLLLVAAAACLVLTLTVAQGKDTKSTLIYNLVFLGIIVILYLAAVIWGFFRMSSLSDYFSKASDTIDQEKDSEHLSVNQKIQLIRGDREVDARLDAFLYDLNHSQSGICDIEDYINDGEADKMIHRRMLELVPDVMTSLGILGTFMGLVWGLREFEPSNYEAMTASVTSLVDGIKVAFLTSIYGLSMSLVFSFSMKNGYSVLMNRMQSFLDRFHASVVPSAEMEAQNRLIRNQQEQNELIRTLTKEFSDQVAHGFAESLTPTLERINQSLGNMMNTITNNQQLFLQEIVDSFMAEMHKSFHLEFDQFGKELNELNEVMNRNILYSENLYKNMCDEMSSIFAKEERNMHTTVAELSAMQKKYADTVDNLSVQYRQIMDSYQKAQETSLKNLNKAEQESSRYWVACNQAMQNYLLEAAEAYRKFEKANEESSRVLTAMTSIYQQNEGLAESYGQQLESFRRSQAEFSRMVGQFSETLAQIQAAGSNGREVYLAYADPQQMAVASGKIAEPITKVMQETGLRQEELLDESLQRQEELLSEIRRTLKENRSKRGFGFWSKDE